MQSRIVTGQFVLPSICWQTGASVGIRVITSDCLFFLFRAADGLLEFSPRNTGVQWLGVIVVFWPADGL